MHHPFRKKNLLALASVLLLSSSVYAGQLEVLNGQVVTFTTSQDFSDIFIRNGGTLRLGTDAKISFTGHMIFEDGAKIIYELGANSNDIGTITGDYHLGTIDILQGAIIETFVNTPPSSFPVSYPAMIGTITIYPDGQTSNITFNPDQASQANLSFDFSTPPYKLFINLTGYTSQVSETPYNTSTTEQTQDNNNKTFTENVVQHIGTSYCSSGESSSFAATPRTLRSVTSMLNEFLSKSQTIYPTRYQKIIGMDGLNEPRIDMNRVVEEGRLPTMQFKNPHLPIRAWIQGIYNQYKNTNDNTNLKTNSSGVQVGVDTAIPFPIGISFAYINTQSKNNNTSNGHIKTYQAGLYGGYFVNSFYFIGSLSYNHSHNEMGSVLKSKYSTNGMNAYVLAAYTYNLSQRNVLEPLVSFSYSRNWTPRVNEFAGSTLVSTSASFATNSYQSEVGARISHLFNSLRKNDTPIKVYAQATWGHDYSKRQSSQVTLVNAGGGITNTPWQKSPKNKANLGAGAVARLDEVDAYVSYAASLAPHTTNHTAVLGFRFNF